VKPQPAAAPNVQTAKFKIAKATTRWQREPLDRRWIQFHNDAPYNSGGGTATLERATDFLDAMDSIAGQLSRRSGIEQLNELRFQYAHRHQSSLRIAIRHRPAIPSRAVDRVRRPLCGDRVRGTPASISSRTSTQVIDNFTYLRANHSYKFGFDVSTFTTSALRRAAIVYVFPTVNA
jgi:hypothetical protein